MPIMIIVMVSASVAHAGVMTIDLSIPQPRLEISVVADVLDLAAKSDESREARSLVDSGSGMAAVAWNISRGGEWMAGPTCVRTFTGAQPDVWRFSLANHRLPFCPTLRGLLRPS